MVQGGQNRDVGKWMRMLEFAVEMGFLWLCCVGIRSDITQAHANDKRKEFNGFCGNIADISKWGEGEAKKKKVHRKEWYN